MEAPRRHGGRRRGSRLGLLAALLVALAAVSPGTSLARVQTAPINHTFAGQTIGTSSGPFTFTLTVSCHEDPANLGTCFPPPDGNDPLTPNVTVTGPFAIQNNNCTSPMPGNTFAGTSCTFGVVFAPQSTGSQTGIVDVGDPDGFGKASVSGFGLALPLPPANPASTTPAPQTPPGRRKCKKRKGAGKAAKRCKRGKR